MIKCPECNNLVDDNLKECSKCGYPFDGTEKRIEDNNDIEEEAVSTNKTVQSGVTEDNNNQLNTNSEKEDKPSSNVLDAEFKQEGYKLSMESDETTLEKKKLSISKRTVFEIIGGSVLIISLVSAINLNGKYNSLSKEYESATKELAQIKQQNQTLESKNSELTTANADLTNKNDELENGAKKQLVDIKNAYEKGEWQNVIDLTAKLHEKYNGTEEDKSAQEMAKTSQSKIDEAKAAKAAEEAQGYETGITYDQLARTPDDYMAKKVKFYGKVIQVLEGDDSIQIRLAVDDNYDTVIYGEYKKSIVSSRVLEDDHITIYGKSVGTISYQSTMGGTITIPCVYIDKIDQ